MDKRVNTVFFITILIIFGFGFISFIKTEKLISESENRTLTQFPHFTIETFLDNSYQDTLETAISDQFILSEEIRVNYAKTTTSLPTFNLEKLVCHHKYLELQNSVDRRRATFDCDDYMLYYPEPLTEEYSEALTENIQKYNHVNTITKTYYYFINDSSTFNFETNQKVVDYPAELRSNLTGSYKLATLDFTNYDEYKQLFYKTDHHWNYNGSYQGFLAITELLGIDTPITPIKLSTDYEPFFGSHAKNTKNYTIEEPFNFYEFEIPEHSTYINGEEGIYNHYSEYINHAYEYNPTTNYYAYLYGEDLGEVIFDFHQPQKDNLLIIKNSFGNAVVELLSQYFNKTYVVDLRHYENTFGKAFKLSEYLKQNHIDKTLFIMSPTSIRQTNTTQGLEL